jgi:hypothetical protein
MNYTLKLQILYSHGYSYLYSHIWLTVQRTTQWVCIKERVLCGPENLRICNVLCQDLICYGGDKFDSINES